MKHLLSLLLVLCAVTVTSAQDIPPVSKPDSMDRHFQQPRATTLFPVVVAQSDQDDEEGWEDDIDFFEEEEVILQMSDPLASWNKVMFHFNDKFYLWVLKPVSKGYRTITPQSVRHSVKNFFHNLTTPVRFVSCLLQGKGHAAGVEFSNFMVNSTFGLCGLFDLTKKYPEMNPSEEDIGQAIGAWGIGNGCYIVWPFLGPSTLRDSIGIVGDRLLNPISYIEPLEASLGIISYDTVNDTSFRIGDYESLKDAAIEPYEAFRDAYIQHREKMVSE